MLLLFARCWFTMFCWQPKRTTPMQVNVVGAAGGVAVAGTFGAAGGVAVVGGAAPCRGALVDMAPTSVVLGAQVVLLWSQLPC